MLGRWWISTAHDDIVIVRPPASPPAGAVKLHAGTARWQVHRWFADEGNAASQAATALDIATSVNLTPPVGALDASRESLAAARAAVAGALARGLLEAYVAKVKLIGAPAPVPPPEPPKPEPPKKKEELTWISLEVVDEDGKPVPNLKYKIEMPDFSTREGRTDKDGKYKLTGIEAGTCKISFPELDKEAWEVG